jgi:hypothetical protein
MAEMFPLGAPPTLLSMARARLSGLSGFLLAGLRLLLALAAWLAFLLNRLLRPASTLGDKLEPGASKLVIVPLTVRTKPCIPLLASV